MLRPPPIDEQITFLRTRDLERSANFYENVLGLSLTLDQGACRIYRVRDGAFIGICGGEPAPETKSLIFTLVTQDVEGWYEHLSAANVELDGPPRYNEKFLITQFFAKDPDGYAIEVQRFEDPRWSQHRERDTTPGTEPQNEA